MCCKYWNYYKNLFKSNKKVIKYYILKFAREVLDNSSFTFDKNMPVLTGKGMEEKLIEFLAKNVKIIVDKKDINSCISGKQLVNFLAKVEKRLRITVPGERVFRNYDLDDYFLHFIENIPSYLYRARNPKLFPEN